MENKLRKCEKHGRVILIKWKLFLEEQNMLSNWRIGSHSIDYEISQPHLLIDWLTDMRIICAVAEE
jgi:hypothetical protein